MEEGAPICLSEVGTGALECGGMCRNQQFSKFPGSSDVKDDAERYTDVCEVKNMWGRGNRMKLEGQNMR